MPFCTNCGKAYPEEARFCISCGKEQIIETSTCVNCGKTLEGDEQFCSGCGTTIGVVPPSKVQSENLTQRKPKEEKFTEEGKKIIGGVPKSEQSKQAYNSASPPMSPLKKKKRGCFGCFFQSILLILVISAIIVGAKFILSKINNPTDSKSDAIEIISLNDKNDVIVPGSDTKNSDKPFESEELKKVCNELETIFENTDLEKLKLKLSDSALELYKEELNAFKPEMSEYAQAFKKRKLVTSTDFFKVYEFTGKNGEKCSATFEFQPGDTWKLVRF